MLNNKYVWPWTLCRYWPRKPSCWFRFGPRSSVPPIWNSVAAKTGGGEVYMICRFEYLWDLINKNKTLWCVILTWDLAQNIKTSATMLNSCSASRFDSVNQSALRQDTNRTHHIITPDNHTTDITTSKILLCIYRNCVCSVFSTVV